jgi:hypothetical protein
VSQNSLEGNRGILACLCPLDGSGFDSSVCSDAFSSLPGGSYQVSHQFVQIEREDRPGASHLQRLPQTFLGLVEPVFVRLQGANDAFGLAPFAAHRLADGLGNVPRPVALGLNAPLLDPLVGQRSQGCCGLAPPVVDHQCGRGVRTKNLAVSCQSLQGHL